MDYIKDRDKILALLKENLSEEKYIHKWLDMGFGEEEIALAYDRTCLNVGSLKWPYMDSIFASWQKQNLYTVDQIRQFDKAPARTAAPQRRGAVEIARADKVDPIAAKAMRARMNLNPEEER